MFNDGTWSALHALHLCSCSVRFDIDRYTSPFTWDMLGWHLVALASQGVAFLLLHLLLETRSCRSVP